MLKISEMTNEKWSGIRVLLTDIDDTVTTDGRLTAEAYSALEAAQAAGYIVIPVTGRCAGWCDHIARMWPVDAVVGENGAFYFRYDHAKKKMHQYFCQSKLNDMKMPKKLENISADIFKLVPGTAIASDQPYRITDLAIDFAEDVEPLPSDEVQKIATLAKSNGATAKISSIHVNCWVWCPQRKLATSILLLETQFGMSKEVAQHSAMFVGDSPMMKRCLVISPILLVLPIFRKAWLMNFNALLLLPSIGAAKGLQKLFTIFFQTKSLPSF